MGPRAITLRTVLLLTGAVLLLVAGQVGATAVKARSSASAKEHGFGKALMVGAVLAAAPVQGFTTAYPPVGRVQRPALHTGPLHPLTFGARERVTDIRPLEAFRAGRDEDEATIALVKAFDGDVDAATPKVDVLHEAGVDPSPHDIPTLKAALVLKPPPAAYADEEVMKDFMRKVISLRRAARMGELSPGKPLANARERSKETKSYRKLVESKIHSIYSDDEERRSNAAGRLARSDIDHVVEIQLGGENARNNLRALNKSVNRSVGSQIRQQLSKLEPGTTITDVHIQHHGGVNDSDDELRSRASKAGIPFVDAEGG